VVTPAADRQQSIVGIGHATRDAIVIAPREAIGTLLQKFSPDPVSFGISSAHRQALRQFAEAHGGLHWTPGGTIPNLLCAAAAARDQHGLSLAIAWRGWTEYADALVSDVGLSHLREWGIAVYPSYRPSFLREAYCVVERDTGDVAYVGIHENRASIFRQDEWPLCDVLILTVAELMEAAEPLLDYACRCRRIALVFADWRSDSRSPALSERIGRLGNVTYLIGHQRDYAEAGLWDAHTAEFGSQLLGLECIATNGANPVAWKAAGSATNDFFAVVGSREGRVNVLGAGDGYAGTFLACRICGWGASDAHASATAHARCVMESSVSYKVQSDDLNEVFPSVVERRSHSATERGFSKRLHLSPGLVVTSCGQSGIDQVAGQAARTLGITCFAIMPEGRRTENFELVASGVDRLDGIEVLELATPSYRYCTWANVFASDGTLLLDYAGSEGSEETRRAAAWLGRPLLELQHVPLTDVAPLVAKWIDEHGVRVVNCAGTRRSLLGDVALAGAARTLTRALMTAAATVARRDCGFVCPPAKSADESVGHWPAVVIGAPNNATMRNVLRAFFSDAGLLSREELEAIGTRELSWRLPSVPVQILFTRSRDLPNALRRDWVNYAVFGEDVRLEDEREIEPLFPIGVDTCCLVEVVASEPRGDTPPRRTVASAWPNLARRFVGKSDAATPPEIVPVGGCVEAWLRSGQVDSAVDTYQTGRAVADNRLHVASRFRTVHTWWHRRAGAPAAVHPVISAFARWLH
jgi:sugar/nucleoside kinase (ribokinase family)